MVSPVMIGSEHPLSNVNGVFNAIYVKGNVIGDVMFYGKGAGKLPTASAVVADMVDAVKHLNRNIVSFWSTKKMELMDVNKVLSRYFIRVAPESPKETREAIQATFGDVDYVKIEKAKEEIAFITQVNTEGQLKGQVEQLKDRKDIADVLSVIRIDK